MRLNPQEGIQHTFQDDAKETQDVLQAQILSRTLQIKMVEKDSKE